jgi:hypothetical protein
LGRYLVLAVDFLLGGEDTRLFVAELEESFNTAAGVFRTLTVVAVGEG